MDADPKTLQQIEKLELTLEELMMKISELEKNEIDFINDDKDEESDFIKVAKYKQRCVEVYSKICMLKKEDPLKSGNIKFSGTNIPSLNRAIERFYNETKEFPSFCDIIDVVKLVNDKKKLGLTESEVHQTAKTAFKELGSIIKLRRQYDLNNVISSYLSPEESSSGDPADNDEELYQKLAQNNVLYAHKLDDIIDHYAKKQEEEGNCGFEECEDEDIENVE